jgi:hypothetical protein
LWVTGAMSVRGWSIRPLYHGLRREQKSARSGSEGRKGHGTSGCDGGFGAAADVDAPPIREASVRGARREERCSGPAGRQTISHELDHSGRSVGRSFDAQEQAIA